MATGTIVAAWMDDSHAYGAIQVGDVEYLARTPLYEEGGAAKSGSQLKIDLAAAVTAIRAAEPTPPQPLTLVGTVTV